MKFLFLDTETRSEVSLKTAGVYNYTAGIHFSPILLSYAIDEGDVQVWDILQNEPMPYSLYEALSNPTVTVVIHNSSFDRLVLKVSDIFDLPTSRVHDTMVQANAHGLPASLSDLSKIFNLKEMAKKTSGTKLIKLFCEPCSRDPIAFKSPEDHPNLWEEFKEYAAYDIVSMRELYKKMPRINYPKGKDFKAWQYDQIMNERGLGVDIAMAKKAYAVYEQEKAKSKEAIFDMTNGEVDAVSKNAKLIEYLKTLGVEVEDLQKSTVDSLLEQEDLPTAARAILELKADVSKTTPTKYKRIIQVTDSNQRLHGTIQFCGATRTGRDAGRIFQPQNLMRPTMWKGLEGDELDKAIQGDIDLLMNDSLDIIYDSPVDVVSNLIRNVIVPREGYKIVDADLSNIEGRMLVWLAGEEWKVNYFRDFDAGKVPFDNYVMAYAKAMNNPPENVGKGERAIGKVMELACGYGGGALAFVQFANVYRLDLQQLAESIKKTSIPELYTESFRKYEWAKDNGYSAGLTQDQYAACEYIKTTWRLAHPRTVNFWGALEQTMRDAINTPDKTFPVPGTDDKIKFRRSGSWTYMLLPSGRVLTYLLAKIGEDNQISFMGVNMAKKFARIKTYSGKLAENATSACAREVLFDAIPRIEKAGFEIVSRVHDELIAEYPAELCSAGHSDVTKKLEKLMSKPHSWCKDLPLAASGFTANRYRGKD